MNTKNPAKRIRSATPPAIRAAVMTANIIWKTITVSGETCRPWKPASVWASPESPA
jgi:hypothetical protein